MVQCGNHKRIYKSNPQVFHRNRSQLEVYGIGRVKNRICVSQFLDDHRHSKGRMLQEDVFPGHHHQRLGLTARLPALSKRIFLSKTWLENIGKHAFLLDESGIQSGYS